MQNTIRKYQSSFGRRRGRAISPRQKQLFAELLPECSVDLAEKGKLDIAALFPGKKEIWLEIGFGGGEHLAARAAENPDTGFIGCEVYENGVAALLVHMDDGNIKNIRIFRDDARLLLENLPENSINRVFLLFPDPWPKARHHKRRIINRQMLDMLAYILKPGDKLRIATDHMDYLRWILIKFMEKEEFKWLAEAAEDWQKPPADHIKTRYESKELEGNRPVFLEYMRR